MAASAENITPSKKNTCRELLIKAFSYKTYIMMLGLISVVFRRALGNGSSETSAKLSKKLIL